MTKYKVRKSVGSDLDSTLELFAKVTDHMLNNGIDQWNYDYPNEAVVVSDIESGNHYVVEDEGKIIGTIVLNEQQDEQYESVVWRYDDTKISVIHRLGVHPDWQGQGIGKQLCLFAEELSLFLEYGSIRLDAYAGNPSSNHLYEKLGYKKANGVCYFRNKEVPFNCYEKKI